MTITSYGYLLENGPLSWRALQPGYARTRLFRSRIWA
jgi:hypothetical protein